LKRRDKKKMKRKDAEKLIGTMVTAWTSMNGEYVGILREVKGSPWRAVVEITGVTAPAVTFEVGRAFQRRGKRPGEMIEVGGVCCKPAVNVMGASYLETLQGQLAQFTEWNARPDKNPKDGWLPRAICDVKRAIDTEMSRLAGTETASV
jgi:hypothetical protein